MSKLEMVRDALAHLGDAPADAVAAFIERTHRVTIPVSMIPVIRASLRELAMLDRFRQESQALAEQVATAPRVEPPHTARRSDPGCGNGGRLTPSTDVPVPF